ncbi:phage/plasmid primase, P4 family [Mesorhizobium sp. BR115XR7A]|uniref:phage/plasmid primase, P4 family n=1 Tax=Mesorhizobium sp. BR115XR7A TaxID=2876645 RepID=UPI001CCB9B32|nr:phage/plasmid primase, P4 family [Mesorhizobium sp. BR115XR7A]MBZ9907777.1 phage/plasmid primase, P4 family [Mesorhizobium sp. BR115XR7A]MBZ9933115.1 phage/plasmid primase, P4 family [Mesorhizobium sp. BR1-1-5]
MLKLKKARSVVNAQEKVTTQAAKMPLSLAKRAFEDLPKKRLPRHLVRDAAVRLWIDREGAPIVPLVPRGKEPHGGYSSRAYVRSATEAAAFFQDNVEANYGIVTGTVSGLVVLDVDGQTGRASLAKLVKQHGSLPQTVTVNTGRGVHYYFSHAGAPIQGRTGHLGAGLDVRAEGNYVVGPGSIHENGQRYEYADGARFPKVRPASLPDWLLSLMTEPSSTPTGEGTVGSAIPEGQRNRTLTSLAGKLRASGFGQKAILAALKAENAENCSPPLGDPEVEKIANSIARYAISDAGKDAAEAIAQALLDTHYAGGGHLLHVADGQFWRYDGKVWEPIAGKVIQGQALAAAKNLNSQRASTASLIGQVEALLKAQVATHEDKLRFTAEPPPVINCLNGEVWLGKNGTHGLRPHTATSYLRHHLPAEYQPGAKCPEFDAALAEIFSKAADPAAMVSFWHELAGYVVQPSRPIPLIVICRGDGRNGKTSLVDTLMRLVGQNQVAAMRVQDINQSRFSMGALLGKLLFVDDDVRMGTRLPDGDLKRISEEKLISTERKFGETYSFIVRTVPMLLCNNPPSLADLSEGMQRRLLVIPFDRTFSEKEIDRGLFKRIWATEMSGILNAALAGWARLQQRDLRFDPPKDIGQAKRLWMQSANPVPAFLAEMCVRSGQCQTRMLYAAFQDWSRERGYTLTQQQHSFKKSLENLGVGFKKNNVADIAINLNLKSEASNPGPRGGHWVPPSGRWRK